MFSKLFNLFMQRDESKRKSIFASEIDDDNSFCHQINHEDADEDNTIADASLKELQVYEKLTVYNHEKPYSCLVYAIGRGYTHSIHDIHNLKTSPGSIKMVKSVFGVVERIAKESAVGCAISIVDPTSPNRGLQVFLATTIKPKLTDIVKLMDIRIECESNGKRMIFSSKISLAPSLQQLNFYQIRGEISNGDEHIIEELRKWYSCKILRENLLCNLEQVRPRWPFNLACKILHVKKFKDCIKMVIFDASCALKYPLQWALESLESERLSILTKLKNLIDPKNKLLDEYHLELFCTVVNVNCINLDEKTTQILNIAQTNGIIVLINAGIAEDDENTFRLSLDFLEEDYADIIHCQPETPIAQAFYKKIKKLTLTLRRKLVSSTSSKFPIHFGCQPTKRSSSVLESSPVKRRKTNDGHVGRMITNYDDSVSLSSIHPPGSQELYSNLLDITADQRLIDDGDEATRLSGHSSTFNGTFICSLCQREETLKNSPSSSQINMQSISQSSSQSNQPNCSLNALLSMGSKRLKQFKKFVESSLDEANLNPELNGSQLIDLIDFALNKIEMPNDKNTQLSS